MTPVVASYSNGPSEPVKISALARLDIDDAHMLDPAAGLGKRSHKQPPG